MDGEHDADRCVADSRVLPRRLVALIISGLAILVLLAGTICFLQLRTSSRLVYQDKSLNVWLEAYDPSSAFGRGSPAWNEADEAVRHIGTNGIHVLLRMLRSADSPWKLRLVALAQKQTLVRLHFVPASARHQEASKAFVALGDEGRSAVPELIRIYERSESLDSRCAAIESLGWIGPASAPAVPMIVQAMTNANSRLRANAAWALGEIRAAPHSCVPRLIRALEDSDPWVRVSAAHALGNYGADAHAAIPALEQVLSSGAPPSTITGSGVQVRLEVRRAVERIQQKTEFKTGLPELSLPGLEGE